MSRLPGGTANDVSPGGEPGPVTDAPCGSETAENGAAEEDLERIAAIWATVLSIDPVSVTPTSDFFALGGDSLASLEMLAQVSRTVVGPDGEAGFVARLEGLVQQMTLARVVEAAVAARQGVEAP